MTTSAFFSSNQYTAVIHYGQNTISCVIEQLSSIGLVVNTVTTEELAGLGTDDQVELQVTTDKSQHFSITVRVDQIRSNKARLHFLHPQSKEVRQFNAWGKPTPCVNKVLDKTEIINKINQISQDYVSGLLDAYITSSDTGLLKMAETASNNTQQNTLFEARALLGQHADNIKQQCIDGLVTHSDPNHTPTLPTQEKSSQTSHEHMELIDLAQFEDWLSLEIIIRRANERYYRPLSYLTKRFSVLLKKELTKENLAISVDNICYTLQRAFKHVGLGPELLPVVYRFFDESVISQLESLYQTLNDVFEQQGILIDIESQPMQEHRLIRPQSLQPTTTEVDSSTHDTPGPSLQPTASKLMDTVKQFQQLIEINRENTVQYEAGKTHQTVSTSELIKQLSHLQNDPLTVNALLEHCSLEQELLKKNQLLATPEALDIIRLIESVFHTIEAYPHISKALMTSIKRLQIPLAKAALIDPTIFSAEGHPARKLVNQMIDLGLDSEIPNHALEAQFDTIINDINTHYDQDSAIFEKAGAILSATTEQQTKTYARNTKRIIQTYQGKQQLKQAINAVSEEINKRIHPPQVPQVVVDLIDNGWRELLKLTYLKLGPDDKTWSENLDVIDQLLAWISEFSEKDAREKNPHRKVEAETFVDFIEQKLNSAFPGDYRYGDTIDQIRDTLNGIRAVKMFNVAPAGNKLDKLAQEMMAAKPELGRWIKLAEKVKVNDEFSYISDDSAKRNIKLIWISDDKQHFVFVNNRGQKVLDFDLFDLANELSQGLVPVQKKSELPLIERSLYSTIQKAYKTLAFRSSHDELTNLLNRKECEKVLGQAITEARNHSQHHCLLYIDIDQFSLVNNLHGHVAGDEQLVEISKLIKKYLSEQTLAARMAGNEFAVLLKNQDEQQSLKTCEDLRAEIENHPFEWNEHDIPLTASIGVVAINQYTQDVIELVRHAIEACQTAKSHGGNCFYDFRQDSELHTRREKLLAWIDKLDHLLSSDKLILRAQAIVPATEDPDFESHFEILLALKNDKDQLISPAEFIEAAESFSRMQKVDRWVIEKTFQWLQTIETGSFKTPSVSINLSGNSLNDNSFTDFLFEQFKKYTVPAQKICFEVTETATINNIAEVADFIREIKKMGCQFSLDDFGSGNASYQYLRHLPVDYIKIDGMFVQEIDKNPDDYSLVKSINEIAHLLGKKTVAEYAETLPIINKLKEIGVDYLQGYAINRPELLDNIVLKKASPNDQAPPDTTEMDNCQQQ